MKLSGHIEGIQNSPQSRGLLCVWPFNVTQPAEEVTQMNSAMCE